MTGTIPQGKGTPNCIAFLCAAAGEAKSIVKVETATNSAAGTIPQPGYPDLVWSWPRATPSSRTDPPMW